MIFQDRPPKTPKPQNPKTPLFLVIMNQEQDYQPKIRGQFVKTKKQANESGQAPASIDSKQFVGKNILDHNEKQQLKVNELSFEELFVDNLSDDKSAKNDTNGFVQFAHKQQEEQKIIDGQNDDVRQTLMQKKKSDLPKLSIKLAKQTQDVRYNSLTENRQIEKEKDIPVKQHPNQYEWLRLEHSGTPQNYQDKSTSSPDKILSLREHDSSERNKTEENSPLKQTDQERIQRPAPVITQTNSSPFGNLGNKAKEILGGLSQNIMSQVQAAEPIYTAKNIGGSDSPAWKKRQIRNQMLRKKQLESTQNSIRESDLSSDEEDPKDTEKYNQMPGDKDKKDIEMKQKENEKIQQKFNEKGAKVPIQTQRSLKIEKHSELFSCMIYDAYKPTDLGQTREYLNFLTSGNVDEDQIPEHLIEYCNQTLNTRIPENINQRTILTFDSNFESGNLDSAYIHNLNIQRHEYNLLMKVDTNTRGNTHWFYFKVSNFQLGLTYRFNILNFTRSINNFYSNGMNVLKRIGENGDWEYNSCNNVYFEPDSGLEKLNSNDTYGSLSFDYTFKEADVGSQIFLAYALPYTYSQLTQDLMQIKNILLTRNEEQQEKSPIFKVMKGLSNLHDPISPTPKSEKRNPSNNRRKVSTFEMQAQTMKRAADQQFQQKKNKFENKMMNDDNQSEMLTGFNKQRIIQYEGNKQIALIGSNNPDEIGLTQNFEIRTELLHYRQEVIAQSMGGQNIYQLTITKKREVSQIKHSKKKVIFIQARLHPAETHGSHIMRAIMFELTQKFKKYDELLGKNIIKLVPMVNPDGVIIGNSRSSLAGVDLNRRWSKPNQNLHPELFFLKDLLKKTKDNFQGISIFCDLHGHNRQMDCFFYGSNKAPNEGLISWTKTRLFPKIFSQNEVSFNLQKCKFHQNKEKYNTARIVIWNELQVTNSFTLETSMFAKKMNPGNNKTSKKGVYYQQLTLEDLEMIGLNLIKSISQFNSLEPILEQEFKTTGGWLKKKRMDEFVNMKKKNSELLQIPSRMTMEKKKSTRRVDDGKESKMVARTASSRNDGNDDLKSTSTQPRIADKEPKIIKKSDIKKIVTQNLSPKNEENEVIDSLKQYFTSKELQKCFNEDNDRLNVQREKAAKEKFEQDFMEANRKVAQAQMALRSLTVGKDKDEDFESDSQPSADNLSLGNLSQRFGEILSEEGTPRVRKRSITARSNSSKRSGKRVEHRLNKTIPKPVDNPLNVVKEVTAEQNIDTTIKRRKRTSSISLLERDEDVSNFGVQDTQFTNQLQKNDEQAQIQQLNEKVNKNEQVTKQLEIKLMKLENDLNNTLKHEQKKLGRILHKMSKSPGATNQFTTNISPTQSQKIQTLSLNQVNIGQPREKQQLNIRDLRGQPGLIGSLGNTQNNNRYQNQVNPIRNNSPAGPKSGEIRAQERAMQRASHQRHNSTAADQSHLYKLDQQFVTSQQSNQKDYLPELQLRSPQNQGKESEKLFPGIHRHQYLKTMQKQKQLYNLAGSVDGKLKPAPDQEVELLKNVIRKYSNHAHQNQRLLQPSPQNFSKPKVPQTLKPQNKRKLLQSHIFSDMVSNEQKGFFGQNLQSTMSYRPQVSQNVRERHVSVQGDKPQGFLENEGYSGPNTIHSQGRTQVPNQVLQSLNLRLPPDQDSRQQYAGLSTPNHQKMESNDSIKKYVTKRGSSKISKPKYHNLLD